MSLIRSTAPRRFRMVRHGTERSRVTRPGWMIQGLTSGLAWALGVLAATLPLSARAADAPAAAVTLAVRAAPHDGYGRIVFEAPSPMGFSAAVEDGTLVVHFDKAASAALAPIARGLPEYVAGEPLSIEGPLARIPLKRPVTVRTFAEGPVMVIDLLTASKPVAASTTTTSARKSEPTPPQPLLPVKAADTLPPAQGDAVVPFRIGEHDDYSRFVFDLEKPTAYTVDDKNGSVTLHIATRAKLGPAPAQMPARVAGLESTVDDKGLTVHLQLGKGGRVRHFLSGPKIVLDVFGPDAARPTRATAQAPAPAAKTPSEKAAPDKPAVADAKAAPTTTGPIPLIEAARRATVASSSDAATSRGDASRVAVTVAHPDSDTMAIRFAWPDGVDPAAAIFVRAGYLWALFDRAAQFEFVKWARADGAPQSLAPASGTSAVRLKLSDPNLGVSVTREGDAWIATLGADPARPRGPTIEVRNGNDDHARLFIATADAGPRIDVKDPDAGDTLFVVPLRRPGTGIGAERRYADVYLLPTGQGLAIQPLADGVVANVVPSGLEIASASGLNLTPVSVRAAEVPAKLGRIFDFKAWAALGGRSPTEARVRLQDAVLAASAPERNARRLDLAHFYFATGSFADALGVLDTIAADQHELAEEPEVKALRGAARLQMNDIEGAASDLMSPTLDGERDVAPWRGALAAARRDWPGAIRQFVRGDAALSRYPRALRVQFGLAAAEASLEVGDPSQARVYLETVSAQGPSKAALDRLHWLNGRTLAAFSEYDQADAEWQKAINGGDPWVRVRARFDRAIALLDAGKISRPEAISELEKLTFAWRGDELEYRILTTLGDMDLAEGETRKGLEVLRKAVTHFPNVPGVKAVSAHMRDAFVRFHLDGSAAKTPTLTELALFQEFKDLVPAGPQGDTIIAQLVGRLVEVDLLDRAEDLLTDLADHRLKGAAESSARNQLGLVYLMDRKPAKALEALDRPIAADAGDDVLAARRELKARALMDTEKYDDALKLLDGDDSDEAKNLRADVFWRTNDWPKAAAALGRLSAEVDPAKLSDRDARLVMRQVIALAMAGDAKGLATMNGRFGGAMAATPFKDAFNLLSDFNQVTPTSVQAITAQLAAADRFGSFLESYRAKLLKAAVPVATNAEEPSATKAADAKPRSAAAAEPDRSRAVN